MDKVFIRDLRVETVIGIWNWERHATQIVSLNLEMATDVKRAAAKDEISAAVNYKDVAKRLIEFVGNSRFELVESLAEAVARIAVTEFSVPWVSVSVAKPGAVEGSKEVGVVIERSSGDYA
ncbi:MAG TPA: dihydroneopterin aldolase [Gammaproteobacteria bacterium]|nr:dihydroneopterin aldolase [Gammaproteobacteria bacterium]